MTAGRSARRPAGLLDGAVPEPGGGHPPPPLHRNRDFALLWSSQAVSVLGSQVSLPAYPLLVLAMTGSPALAGLVGFARTLPNLVLQLPAGVLVDRWDRKRLMIGCDAVRAVGLASVVLAIGLGRPTLAQLVVVAFVEGTMTVLFELAQPGAIRRVVPPEQISAAVSRNEARIRGAWLLGQPLGGFLFGLSRLAPFVADLVSYVVSLAGLTLMRADFQEERQAGRRHLLAEAREGVVWLWRHPFLRTAVLLLGGANLGLQALVLVLIVVARGHGAPPAVVGVMLGGVGVGGLAGAMVAVGLQQRLSARVILTGATWVWAGLMPLVALTANPYLLGALLALMTSVGPALNVVVGTFQLRLVPDALLGRVTSVALVVAFGAIPLGSLAAGLLLQWAGPLVTVLALAAWMLALALVATLSPGIRNPPE